VQLKRCQNELKTAHDQKKSADALQKQYDELKRNYDSLTKESKEVFLIFINIVLTLIQDHDNKANANFSVFKKNLRPYDFVEILLMLFLLLSSSLLFESDSKLAWKSNLHKQN